MENTDKIEEKVSPPKQIKIDSTFQCELFYIIFYIILYFFLI